MTKAEFEWTKNALSAAIRELAEHKLKLPLPYLYEDEMVVILSETREGRQYKKLICDLHTKEK